MMNKHQLLYQLHQFLSEEHLYLDQVTVTSGAAMVLHGLRDAASDLDLEVPNDIFIQLREKYTPGIIPLRFQEDLDFSHPWQFTPYLRYSETIEIFVERSVSVDVIDDVIVYSLEALLEEKRLLNRAKDQADIRLLETVFETSS